MATMADLDELALSLPQATKETSEDGRPAYLVHGKLFCCHRSRRPDAIDPGTGERLDDVLMFRVADLGVKELLLADERGVFFTTPHFDGYAAVLVQIPELARVDRDELHDLVAEAWLTRAQKRVAKAWLNQQGISGD
ncbi:MAG: MmcQ/YjbR family DNA-binding protein [Gaiellaceae bacterium]